MLILDKINLNQKQSQGTQRRVQSAPQNLPTKRSPGPKASRANSIKQSKKNINPSQAFQKN